MRKFFIFFMFISLIAKNSYAINEKIIIQYQDRPPFFIEDKIANKLIGGIEFTIINKILIESKLYFIYEKTPLIRTFKDIKENNKKICYPYAYKTKEREENGLFSNPFQKTLKSTVIIRSNDIRFKNLNTFDAIISNDNLIPILKIGYNYHENAMLLLKKHKNYLINNSDNEKNKKIKISSLDLENLFSRVSNKQADYTITTLDEDNYYANKNPMIKNVLIAIDLINTSEMLRHFYCAKKVGIETINILNEAIKKEVKSL